MKRTFIALSITAVLASCGDKNIDIPLPPPSSGSTMQLNGGNGGSAAENSVYVDFSTDKQDSVKRNSWDLGFYCGSEFKVIINNTNGTSVKMLSKTDLNTVTEADFNVADLKINLGSTDPLDFAKIDDPKQVNILNKPAINAISATEADNKVYLISPAGGTHTAVINAETVYKIRILRKGSSGYTIQYAKLKDATFKTFDMSKDAAVNFSYFSLSGGKTINVEPAKENWDFVWSWSMYYDAAAGYVYSYSDIVFTNNLGGVTAFERAYIDESTAADAYSKFNKDSVTKYTFSNARDIIGSKWRFTLPTGGEPAGVRKNRFYVVKDATGNLYKLKFISMGAGNPPPDGGTRGKPEIKYELIK